MNIMEFLKNIKWQEIAASGFRILIILVLAWVLSKILKKVLAGFKLRLLEKGRLAGNNPDESVKRIETVTRLIRQVVLTAMWCIVSLIILKEIGVEIAPILAGAGILGLAVGFGAQNLVKDIISGFFFILEDQVRVGDIAVVNGQAGQVEAINIRTILLRDLAGVVHLFPHGSITTVSNMTKDWSAYVFDIGVAYKE
ncbi:MAG TPA: mechanosensitive ion channel, partial [Smithellaceae bacterium]|nr:mechanosensitive ion channel [Smithellaceae bacterium]